MALVFKLAASQLHGLLSSPQDIWSLWKRVLKIAKYNGNDIWWLLTVHFLPSENKLLFGTIM